jgi:transposase
MGLAMDRDGIPIAYKLFPGNIHDDETFRGVIGDVCRHYNTGRIVVVGDMGIITGNNIWYLIGGNPYKPLHGYVFSFSVRGGTDDFKKYVLSENGYKGKDGAPLGEGCEFKMKSRRMAREIYVTMMNGKVQKKLVYEKQVIFWNKKYADKAKTDRERALVKAAAMVSEPSKYNRSSHYGAAKYIREVDKKSGEVEPDKLLHLNTDTIAEEELYDGYYAIVTSEMDMDDGDIIDTYRGLWEIEELFRISKGELEARPIFVSRNDHINAHFLICFIALVIIKLLKKATGVRFSSECLIDALNRVSCSLFHDNLFVFDYRTPVTDAICDALHIDFSKKYLPLGEIKNFLGSVKKPSVPI